MQKQDLDPQTLRAIDAFKGRLASSFPVEQTILFGSRARLSHQPQSDADVAVLLLGAKASFMETKFAMDDVAFDVLLDTGIRIQPLPIWHDEWADPEGYPNPSLLKNIRREGVQV
jgi:predicted nucleotidyltransferase